jgi:glucose-1-phosphate thymidylyltransferase
LDDIEMKGLLLAGGSGTRLRPLTFTGNKHMLPIANTSMLLYGLNHLKNAGITDIGIILGPIKEGVVDVIGDGKTLGVNVTYIDQPDPKGLAHAVMISKNFLQDDSFVMYLGDNLIKNGIVDQVNVFKESKSDCVVGTIQVTNPSQYGVIDFKSDGTVNRFVEKPKEYISDWALIGVYVFNNQVWEAISKIKPSWRNELEITDTIQQMLDDGKRVTINKVQGWWKDTGKPGDLLEANRLILQDISNDNNGTISENVKINGNVSIGKNTEILGGTVLRGPLIIGEDCRIGPNTYVGPYTSIGKNCFIAHSEIQNSIVMEGSSINCGTLVTDSIIGRNVKITHNGKLLPKGKRFIIGDQSQIIL